MEESKILNDALQILFKKSPLVISILAIFPIFFREELKQLVRGLISWYLERQGSRIANALHPARHSFFRYMQRCEQNIIPNLILENKTKERILKEFLLIKFRTFREKFYEFVKDEKNYKKITSFDLQDQVMKIFYDSITEYNEKTREKFLQMGIDKDTIDYIIHCFDEWHASTVNIIGSAVQETCISPFLDTGQERVSQVLDLLKIGFKLTVHDGLKSIQKVNGRVESIQLHDFKV